MRTTEGFTEELQRKMLLELYKLLPYYNWLILAGVIVGGSLFLEAFALDGVGWGQIAVGWLGLSLLVACGWIYLRAFRWTKYEILVLEEQLGISKENAQRPIFSFFKY